MNISVEEALKLLEWKRDGTDDIWDEYGEEAHEAVKLLYQHIWDEWHANEGVFNTHMHRVRQELMEWLPAGSVRHMYEQMGTDEISFRTYLEDKEEQGF